MMSQPIPLKSMKSLKYSTMNAMLTYLDKCFNMDVQMKTFQDQAATNTLINKYYYPNYKNSINNTINKQEYIETYIAHKDIFLLPDKKHLRLFILKDHILFTKQFKMDDTLTQNPIDTILQYKQIHSLSSDLTDKEAQLILYQIQGESFDSLHTYSICFTIQRDMIIFKHLIQRQLDLTWQCFFEKALPIPEPFYYQKHFFIEKQNRRRKRQQRTIVLCNKLMFNVEGFLVDGNFNVKTTKWAVRIESFKEICFQSNENNILVIMIDSDKNKRRKDEAKLNFKRKDKIELVFDEEEDKQKFLFECRRLFFNINNQALPVRINK